MKYILTTLLLLTLTTFSFGDKVRATVSHIEGIVHCIKPGSLIATPVLEGMILDIGSVIKTSDGSEVMIFIAPGAAIQIKENTIVNLKDMAFGSIDGAVVERKARIELSEGTVVNLLEHDEPKITDFRVITPDGTAAARGTYYAVSVVDGKTFVQVQEGKVGVRLHQ